MSSPPRDHRKPPAELRLGNARRGPSNIPRGTPARVIVLFTLLTSMVVVSTWRDALQAAHVTGVRYPTALGDSQYFQPGTVVALMGYEWEATREVLARGEDAMFRLETATDSAISIFTDREILPETTEPKIYAHTGPDEFLRLKPYIRGAHETALPASEPDDPEPFAAVPGAGESGAGQSGEEEMSGEVVPDPVEPAPDPSESGAAGIPEPTAASEPGPGESAGAPEEDVPPRAEVIPE